MNFKTVYKAILLFSIVAAVIAGIFMTVSLLHSSDTQGIKIYSSDNVEYYKLVSWIFGICTVGYIVAISALGKRVDKRVDFSAKNSKLAYGIMAISTAALTLFCLGREFLTGESYDHGNMYVIFSKEQLLSISNSPEETKVSYLYLLFLAALIGAFAFFVYAFATKCPSGEADEKFGMFSMLPSLALVVKIIYDFLLQSGNGYGALYNFHLLGMGFALLFSVYESRFYFKKAAPALYIFFGLLAGMASFIFSIPALVLFFAGKAGANWHPAFCIADIFIIAYIYIRLFSLKVHQFERQKKETEITTAFDSDEEVFPALKDTAE